MRTASGETGAVQAPSRARAWRSNNTVLPLAITHIGNKALTTLRLCTLADVAHWLPKDMSAVANALEQASHDESVVVLEIDGDLDLESLDLDQPCASRAVGTLGALCAQAKLDAPIEWILVQGNLRVRGAITNRNTDGAVSLIVLGSVSARHMVVGGQCLYVRDALHLERLLWGDYNHGELYVQGSLYAELVLWTDEYHWHVQGEFQCKACIDETQSLDPLLNDRSEFASAWFQSQFWSAGSSADGVTSIIDRDAVVATLESGAEVLVPDSRAWLGELPRQTLSACAEISVEALERMVDSGIMPEGERWATRWFDQVQYHLSKRQVDDDQAPRRTSLYLAEWKQYDFSIVIENCAESSGVLANRLGTTAPQRKQLGVYGRRYDEAGNPLLWFELNAQSDPPAWQHLRRLWRLVVRDVWLAQAQRQAGLPLARALAACIDAHRLSALVALPELADYDWWDDDNAGFWEAEIWVGSRRAGEHNGTLYAQALKLAWHNGEDQPGDDADDAISYYLIEQSAEPSKALRMSYCRRIVLEPAELPADAVEHGLRLLRALTVIQRLLWQREAAARAREETLAQARAFAQLLPASAWHAHAGDEAFFPEEVLAVSTQWQALGARHVETINTLQRQHEHNLANDSERSESDESQWPQEPRSIYAEAVLALARTVSARQNALLQQRFRGRFAFAPDAYVPEHAAKHGQYLGPIVALDDQRIALGVGAEHQDDRHWVLIDRLDVRRLSNVHGIGRSQDRAIIALHNGIEITTHRGYQGECVARLPLPTGHEGIPWFDQPSSRSSQPESRACAQLIAFNDGRRVLLRNGTGVYLLTESGVTRLHPQNFGADSPYHWPKNRTEHQLSLSMVHMALSPDERYIVVGDQDSVHILLDAEGRCVREIEPSENYPHCAWFSHDGRMLFANACHFYQGSTSRTALTEPSLTEPFNHAWRIYAAMAVPDTSIVGTAEGYIHAYDDAGLALWRHHIGSSISAIEITPNGETLLVASYAGYLVRLEQADRPDPYCFGNSRYHERSRYIFWTDEIAPIVW